MLKKFVCIECPRGCLLEAEIENGRMVKVNGNKCPRGEDYARGEIENPARVLTSTIPAEGLRLKMVPVRTNRPIAKSRMLEAAAAIRKLKTDRPVRAGEVIAENLLGLGADLVATRDVPADTP
ncbi:MAG: DUF1667 domain-containing protein [Candidatus Omnitrophota bacterium]|jgi:CxxC motif-containing protein|nr:DUF1667 domain-containing protein [Candidatus Omnitrophota bacterium]